MSFVEETKDFLNNENNNRFHVEALKLQFIQRSQDEMMNNNYRQQQHLSIDSTNSSINSNHSNQSLPAEPHLYQSELLQAVDYFGKLKFKYVEQQTKENFLKKILATQPPLITPEDNIALEESNRNDKAQLKSDKVNTDNKTKELEELVNVVCDEHEKYTAESDDANALIGEIQEMQLELAKLRATHPPEERLTPAVAQEILDNQIIEMQNLSDKLEQQAQERNQIRNELANVAKQVDALGPERTAAERLGEDARRAKMDVEDGIEELNTWLDCAREVYSQLVGILEISTPEPSTLQIVYDARKNLRGKFIQGTHPKCTLTIKFNINTRRFVTAELKDAPGSVNLDDAIEAAELHRSAPQLVQELLYRLRTQ